MDDEECKLMDAVKRKTLQLAQDLEYEDEFDDIDLELDKQVSRNLGDITNGNCQILYGFIELSESDEEERKDPNKFVQAPGERFSKQPPSRGGRGQNQGRGYGKGQGPQHKGPQKEESKKRPFTDFKSYKAVIAEKEEKVEQKEKVVESWVDEDDENEEGYNPQFLQSNDNTEAEGDQESQSHRGSLRSRGMHSGRGDPRGRGEQRGRGGRGDHRGGRGEHRGRGRGHRGGQPGKSVYQMTPEEIEQKEKLKKGRENNTRKKGGHHNRKEAAAKKYAV